MLFKEISYHLAKFFMDFISECRRRLFPLNKLSTIQNKTNDLLIILISTFMFCNKNYAARRQTNKIIRLSEKKKQVAPFKTVHESYKPLVRLGG
jgi:hypothetical protein